MIADTIGVGGALRRPDPFARLHIRGTAGGPVDLCGHALTPVNLSTVAGYLGPALQFPGSPESLTIGSVGDFDFLHSMSGTRYSIAFFYDLNLSSAGSPDILTTNDGDPGILGFELWFNQPSRRATVYVNNAAGQTVVALNSSTNSLPTSGRHYFVYTYDHSLGSANGKMYLDGTLIGSGGKQAATPSTSQAGLSTHFGSISDGSNGAVGTFEEIRIWDGLAIDGTIVPLRRF